MLPKTIPTVNRFIHFPFALICASVFLALPYLAHASTTYLDQTGLGIDVPASYVQTTGSGFTFTASGNGNVGYLDFIEYQVPAFGATSFIIHCKVNGTTIANSASILAGSINDHRAIAPYGSAFQWYYDEFKLTDPFSGACTFTSGDVVLISISPSGDNAFYATGVGGSNSGLAWGLIADSAPVANTDTRIITVSPYDGQTIATSSLPWNYETTGYTKTTDYKTGERLRLKIDRNTDSQSVGALTAFNSAFGNYTYIPIGSDGSFDVSTSTISNTFGVDRLGLYYMSQDIQVPGIGVHWWIFNFDLTYNTLVSTSTAFTVGTTTSIDNITINGSNYLNSIANGTGDALASCQFNWFSSAVDFSLGSNLINCMGGLINWAFVPTTNAIQSTISQVQTGFLIRAPWGYATRVVTILSDNTATSSLPTFTAPLYLTGTSTPDTTLTFDPGDMLDGGAALLSNIKANGLSVNLEDIFKPFIQLFVAMSVLIIIFHDVMAMGHHKKY